MNRRGGLAALVLGLLAACVVPEQSALVWESALDFDADPGSADFGELRLAEASTGSELREAERLALEERVREKQDELLEAAAVWTGEVTMPEGECRDLEEQPKVLGRVEATASGLIFEPRFPWVAGLRYTACLDIGRMAAALGSPAGGGGGVRALIFKLPEPVAATPRVTAVWPDIDEVPANLLRFYIHFDQPMQRRGVAEHVRLLDAAGHAIAEPFVEIPDGLWDPDGRRLTLLVHPGRLKRGVGPREALGSVLQPGETVQLEIAGSIEAESGLALGESVRISHRVAAPDRDVVQPDRWVLTSPRGSRTPLIVDFGEPLDRAQLTTALGVLREGKPVAGQREIEDGGRVWRFTPAAGWREGSYELVVDRGLEDLAGNTLERLFDVDTAGSTRDRASGVVAPSTPRGEVARVDFEVELTDG